MSGIDQRVVEMKFDKNSFSSGVQSVLDELAKLKEGLKLDGATKGLAEIDSASNKVNFAGMADNADKAGFRIRAMTIFVGTAIATLSHQVFIAGENMLKSLTIAPITSGFSEYETKLGSIQTVLANTARYGTTLGEVNAALNELNTYADKTIYDFGEMTKNVGLFTNAGLKVDEATKIIEGFSNVAAASGTNAEGAANAAYQLSQALSAGTIRLMDWRSLTNVGMGNKNMQDGLLQIAGAMGTLSAHGVTATSVQKDFNGSLEKGWLSADVMSNYLKIMAGSLTDAEMKTLGLTQTQIDAFKVQQKTAEEAATKVRSFTQLIGTIREAVGSGWSQTFEILFGDFNEATDLFTGINNVIGGFVNASSEARNKVLGDWKALGGRTVLIDSIKLAFQALMSIITPIKDAFREIFPAMTGQTLYNMTVSLHVFVENLKVLPETANNIKRTFAGFFAVLDIGWQILKAGVTFIVDLFKHFTAGGSSILGVTGNIGDFLVKLDETLKKGDVFGKFFDWLASKIEAPVDAIKRFISFLGQLGGAIFNSDRIAAVVSKIHGGFQDLNDIGEKVTSVWDRIKIIFLTIWDALQPVFDKIGSFLGSIGGAIKDFIKSLTIGDIFAGIGLAFAGGVAVSIKKFIDTLRDKFSGANQGPGVFDAVKESLDKLTGTLQQMQNLLKAATLLEIAAAIGILTIAVSVLSKIDAAGLGLATAAIATMLIELTATMVAMDKMMKKAKGLKLDMIAAGMILVAIAIDVLASAVKKLSGLDWASLAKGMSATIALMAGLAATVKLMPTEETPKMVAIATGLLILSAAIKVLVSAVKDLSDLKWTELAKGISSVAVLLATLMLFTRFSKADTMGVSSGLGLLLLAAAMKVLASAVKDLSDLSWVELAKGMSAIAVGLGAIAIALKQLPKENVLQAAAILIVAASLKVIASAVKDLSKLKWDELAKGMSVFTVALGAITLALKKIPEGAIFSSGAIALVAAGMLILAYALEKMGHMSWGEIGKSLVELAGALAIIVIALEGIEVGILGAAGLVIIAAAMVVLAEAMTKFGKMTWSEIAKSLVELAAALLIITIGLEGVELGIVGAAALVIVAGALWVLAEVMDKLGSMSWSDILAAIGALTLLFVVLAVGGALSPLILLLAVALGVLSIAIVAIGAGIYAMGVGFNNFADAMKTLAGIDAKGMENVSNALQKIIDLLPSLATSAAQSVSDFITTLGDNAPAMAEAFGKLVSAFTDELANRTPDVVAAFMKMITDSLDAMSRRMPEVVQKGADVVIKFLNGLAEKIPVIASAGTSVIVAFLGAIGANAKKVADAGFQMIIDVMNGIADSIRQHSKEMRAAGSNIGSAIIEGITGGVNDGKGGFNQAIKNIANGALSTVKFIFGIKSPSTAFAEIGMYAMQGLAKGVDEYSSVVTQSAESVGSDVISAMGKSIAGLGALVNDQLDPNPTISPVLDLSNIQRDAQNIATMLTAKAISIDATYSTAQDASVGVQNNQNAQADLAYASAGDQYAFTQNNYSPKALSQAEIYRQTNNQLSVAKGGLTNVK